MVDHLWWKEKDLLWHFWLCGALNTRRHWVRYDCGFVVFGCAGVWAACGQSPVLPHQERGNKEEDIERKNFINFRWSQSRLCTRQICQRTQWISLRSCWRKTQRRGLRTRNYCSIRFWPRCEENDMDANGFKSTYKDWYYFKTILLIYFISLLNTYSSALIPIIFSVFKLVTILIRKYWNW